MDVTVVCVPYENDVARWGNALGPQAFLDAGLVQHVQELGHRVQEPVWVELPRQERTRDIVTNLGRIAARTAEAVAGGLRRPDGFVLALEGNCTHAVGAIGGVAQALGTPGVAWIDAHGDLNTTETTTSGLWGGMPYAVALGWDLQDWREAAGLEPPVPPQAAALIGDSDLDAAESEAIARHGLLRFDAAAMQAPGVAERLRAALAPRAAAASAWYLHLDIDVAGPDEAPGGLTPAPSWPPRERLIEAATAIAQAVPVRTIALSAYNQSGDPARRGARFAVDMALAALQGMRV